MVVLYIFGQWRSKGGRWWGPPQAAHLQGRQFRSQIYFYYTNRGANIYLAPGGNTPLLRHCIWLYKVSFGANQMCIFLRNTLYGYYRFLLCDSILLKKKFNCEMIPRNVLNQLA